MARLNLVITDFCLVSVCMMAEIFPFQTIYPEALQPGESFNQKNIK